MHQIIAHFFRVGRVYARPFQRLAIEQHGVTAAGLHEQYLVGANLVQICLGNVFVIFNPPRGHVEIALRVLFDKLLDDLAVFVIIRQTDLREVRLSDGAVTGQIAVAMRLKEAGIDVVLAVIEHLRISICKFFYLFGFADISKYTVLNKCSLCKGSLFVHSDNVSEYNRLFHYTALLNFMVLSDF